ncbi:MAG: MFS transporter [Rhodospirillaceae bacterium]
MNIGIVFAIVLCNMSAFRASRVLISLFAIELGAAQVTIGALIAMYSVFPMLMGLYAGHVSDKLGVGRPMAYGSIGISLGMLVPFLWPSIPALYVSAALIGASHVFYNVSVQNLVGYLSTPADRTKNFSNYGLVMAMGGLVGPLMAGVAVDHLGHARSYLVLALAPLITVAIISRAKGIRAAAKGGDEGGGLAGARELMRDRGLRRTLLASGIVLTGNDLFQFYMPIYGTSIGLSATAIGAILAVFAGASFIVRLVLPALAKRHGEEVLMTWSLFLGAATYVVFPFITSVIFLVLIAFALGLALGCSQPLSVTLTFARAPEGRSGEALGLRMTINNFTHVAVPLVFGTVGSVLGIAPVFLANAAMLAGGGVMSRRNVEERNG